MLAVTGRIDTATASTAEVRSTAELATAGALALDLTQLEYISSAGLRVLLRLAKNARRDGKEFALVGVQGLVKEVLTESGMDELFRVVETTAEL